MGSLDYQQLGGFQLHSLKVSVSALLLVCYCYFITDQQIQSLFVKELPVSSLTCIAITIPSVEEVALMQDGDRLSRIVKYPPVLVFVKHVVNKLLLA